MSDDTTIRPLRRDELDTAIEWAAGEGWNPGLDDGDPFYAADPGGFLGSWRDGRLIACISAIRYGAGFGFIGFYICRPDYRGQGYGWQLWQAAMARLGERTVGLDGVIDQQANYKKSGFELAHRNIRYGGRPACAAPDDSRLHAIDAPLRDRIAAYDAAFFPADRQDFLRRWIAPGASRSGFALIENGQPSGYGIVRRCRDGCKIGPLFADTEAGADLLFRALAGAAGGGAVYLDLPEPNAAAAALAERYALAPVFETARMYRGGAPRLPLARIFGITTFELG